MSHDLSHWVQQFSGRRVLVAGGFALDRHCYGDAEGISPEAPVPVLRLKDEILRAGGAGHVAAALAGLGVDVVCSGAIGDDPSGEQLVDLLNQAGVRTEGLTVVPGRQTTTHTRLIGLAQHRHPQQMMHVEQACPAPLPPEAVDRMASAVRDLASKVEAVCTRDSDTGDWPEALCRASIEASRQVDIPVVISPVVGGDWLAYRDATVLMPNRLKLALAAGASSDHAEWLAQLARPLLDQLGLQGMVITLDRDGALVVPADGEPTPVPTRARSVYDITGAGDVMLAVLGAAVAAGAGLVDAVRLANVGAGLSVEQFGAVTISRDEILAEVTLEGHTGVGKLRSLGELMAELAPRRSAGSKVVFTNGCFDLLHAGHIQYFGFCRKQGDIVVVGLNGDESVRAQGKGEDRPINNQLDRARMLGGLQDVDYVAVFDEPTPESMIRTILPDVLVKGQDWADTWICGKEIVEEAGGRVAVAPMMQGYSTTQLLARIRGMEARRERDD